MLFVKMHRRQLILAVHSSCPPRHSRRTACVCLDVDEVSGTVVEVLGIEESIPLGSCDMLSALQ